MGIAIFELIFIVALIKCCMSIYDDIQRRKERKKASEKDAQKRNKWEDAFDD